MNGDSKTRQDPVRTYFKQRGCARHVVDGGLTGLVESWEQTVRSVASGYTLTLDDYLNDLDSRQLIDDVWSIAGEDQRGEVLVRLRQSDDLMRRVTRPLSVCLWGEKNAIQQGWTPEKNWWYFSRPVDAAPELLREIESRQD